MTGAAGGAPPDGTSTRTSAPRASAALPSDEPSTAASSAAVSPAELLAAARRHGLELVTDASQCDESGLDFVVVHARDAAGTDWIVRRPRRASVIEAARGEARALALVRPRLPVAVPDWRVLADDVIAYPRLPGTPALSFDPAHGPSWHIDSAEPPPAFLSSLGHALAALQAISVNEARVAGVRLTSIADERASLDACMQKVRGALAPSEALWRRWREWLSSDATWPSDVTLVHGDLHPGHLLLDDACHVTGILDWTTAHVGDAGTDFGLLHGAFGRAGLEGVLNSFRRAGGRTWPALLDHARERWASFPAVVADFAMQTSDASVLEHARRLLAAAENDSA